jgi:hypothetical protein
MPDHQQRFKMHLQQAKSAFEAGVAQNANKDSFDSVLFAYARAYRIARDAPEDIKSLGLDPDEFLTSMKDVAEHRNVAEHWGDIKIPRPLKSHQLTTKGGLKIAVDESSLIYMGPEEVYVGKLNLHDVYKYIVLKLEQIGARG